MRWSRNAAKPALRAVACDLSGLDSAKDLVAETVKRFGRLDILVANHGIWPPKDAPVDEMTDAQWRGTVSVNLDSVFSLIRHSVAQMKKQRKLSTGDGGHIVLVSSTAAQRGEAYHVDYAATKGALISMVKGLSTELAKDGILVNCVAPGWVGTEMSEPALNDPKRATRFSRRFRWAAWPRPSRSQRPSCSCAPNTPHSLPAKSLTSTEARFWQDERRSPAPYSIRARFRV